MKRITLFMLVLAGLLASSAAAANDSQPAAAPPLFGLVLVHVEPAEPYQPGDHVWYTDQPASEAESAAQVESQVSTLATGCQRVPASGFISTNVYADSTAQYANYWYWSSGSSNQPFYWYLKKTDDSTQDWGYSSAEGGSTLQPANIYYWKVQNKGSIPQAWNVCFDVI